MGGQPLPTPIHRRVGRLYRTRSNFLTSGIPLNSRDKQAESTNKVQDGFGGLILRCRASLYYQEGPPCLARGGGPGAKTVLKTRRQRAEGQNNEGLGLGRRTQRSPDTCDWQRRTTVEAGLPRITVEGYRGRGGGGRHFGPGVIMGKRKG